LKWAADAGPPRVVEKGVVTKKKGSVSRLMETDPLEIQQSKRLAAPHAPGYEKCAETEENRGGGLGNGLRAAAVCRDDVSRGPDPGSVPVQAVRVLSAEVPLRGIGDQRPVIDPEDPLVIISAIWLGALG
jgi:hypothetical protein